MDLLEQVLTLYPYLFVILIILAIAIAYAGPNVVFWLYGRESSTVTKNMLREIIYNLDEFADNMANEKKRENAITKLKDIISFRGITLPKFILGWIVDKEVAHIRYLQSTCPENTDLHHERD